MTTARPWHIVPDDKRTIAAADDGLIAKMFVPFKAGEPIAEAEADAELIVKAVNSFPALVAALKDIVAMQRSDCQGLYGAQKIARAALQQVEE